MLPQCSFFHLQVDVYQQLEKGIDQMTPIIAKFRQKVSEKDPDKQTYGPTMLKKMQVGQGTAKGMNTVGLYLITVDLIRC